MHQQLSLTADLIVRIKAKEVTIGVIGLGYVGLPMCIAAGEAGMQILGFDTDPAKPRAVKQGPSYLKHIPSEVIRPLVEKSSFAGHSQIQHPSEPGVLPICVPTP